MSESESGVRLQPPTDTMPRRSFIPRQALGWKPPFVDDAKPLVSVFITSKAFVRVCAYSGQDLEHEVGGGLVGNWRIDTRSGEHYVVIEAVLPARFTRQGHAFLTFTQDTLVAMNEQLEDVYPEKQLVGWYHTHPRMGVFLSHYDLWLHEHFFPEVWQVALVIEPHTSVGGFFIRQDKGYLDPYRYFGFFELVEDRKASAVHWKNMMSIDEPPIDSGVENDE